MSIKINVNYNVTMESTSGSRVEVCSLHLAGDEATPDRVVRPKAGAQALMRVWAPSQASGRSGSGSRRQERARGRPVKAMKKENERKERR